MHKKILVSLFIGIALLVAALGLLDQASQAYTDEALTAAAVTYGLARAINGVISVAQGTEISALTVVTLSVGEILDPINDLVERFSWIAMMAMAALGIQQLLGQITAAPLFNALLALSGSWLLWQLWRPYPAVTAGQNNNALALALATRIFAVALFVRFALAVTLLINQGIEQHFLADNRQQAEQQLQSARDVLKGMEIDGSSADQGEQDDPGMMASMKQAWQSMTGSSEAQMDEVSDVAESTVGSILDLIVIFCLQTLVLPLLCLWLLYQALRWLIAQPIKF